MNILVVGGGGREHAIIHALRRSRHNPVLYAAPGNGGISDTATCLDIKALDFVGIKKAVREYKIDMVFVAPDDPLAHGLVDEIEAMGIRAFGPNKAAAIIESSKVFSKGFMKKYNIPTAGYESFDDKDKAIEYIKNKNKYPVFIKADGLAVGKGAMYAGNQEEAINVVRTIMEDKVFGNSGNNIVVEEYLEGKEVTVLAFCDGKTVKPMASSQDHKRAYDNDMGLNTGGMGAISPSPYYTDKHAEECMQTIFIPTINGMIKEGRPFKGVLYFGLMLTKDGVKVIEYNARFGDPEAQVILPRLKTDFVDIINAVIDGTLDGIDIEWEDNAAVCVIMASGGYPEKYQTGYEISGLTGIDESIMVYHAGTVKKDGKYYTGGGRVLGVTAVAPDLSEAIECAYKAIPQITFENVHYRTDIGRR